MAIDVIGEPTAALGLAWLGVFASLWVANPLKGRLPLSLRVAIERYRHECKNGINDDFAWRHGTNSFQTCLTTFAGTPATTVRGGTSDALPQLQ